MSSGILTAEFYPLNFPHSGLLTMVFNHFCYENLCKKTPDKYDTLFFRYFCNNCATQILNSNQFFQLSAANPGTMLHEKLSSLRQKLLLQISILFHS